MPFRRFSPYAPNDRNLACAYCYIYEDADQSWRSHPTVTASRCQGNDDRTIRLGSPFAGGNDEWGFSGDAACCRPTNRVMV
jgi:hypothetical protein